MKQKSVVEEEYCSSRKSRTPQYPHSQSMASLLRPPPLPVFFPVFSFRSSSQLLPFETRKPFRRIAPVSSSSFRNGSNSPAETECPVPFDQQPINEYQNLSTSFPFSWAAGDLVEYSTRLFVTGASFALLVGLPVTWFGAPGPEYEPLKRVLGAASSGVFVVTLAVVRMYLGWAYVGNRLLSATVEYEETGWYDGQVWVKTAEVLARDRLLGSFTVKPVLNKLKYTLVALGGALFVCAILLLNIEGVEKASYATRKGAADRAIPGVYSDDSARSFEPDAFCGEPAIPDDGN